MYHFILFLYCIIVPVPVTEDNSSSYYYGDSANMNNTVFYDVNVIPMTHDTILHEQTVIIQNGIIREIGNKMDIVIPAGSDTIDGSGMYIMPGLADMHVHITNKKDLILFLANGVTTIQNMHGYEGNSLKFNLARVPVHFDLRGKIQKGDLLGPHMYTAGPILDGKPLAKDFMKEIETSKQGSDEVILQKENGYDFIKVNDHLSEEVYNSILKTANLQKIPVKGHVPFSVGIEKVLKSGQLTIEHLSGYIDPEAVCFLFNEDSINSYSKRTMLANVWNCPTMVIRTRRGLNESKVKELEQVTAIQYLSRIQRLSYKRSIKVLSESTSYKGNYSKSVMNLTYKMVYSLHKEGAKLLLGTDCGSLFIFPGWSAHEELKHFVEAGLTPYEAIKTATVNSAEHLGILNKSGTLEVGKQADLILLKGDPQKDISNIEGIVGVMINGTWYSRKELLRMI